MNLTNQQKQNSGINVIHRELTKLTLFPSESERGLGSSQGTYGIILTRLSLALRER